MSDYFERIEAQLLDAVERRATRPGRRAWARRGDRRPRRIALATATAICVLVAFAAGLALLDPAPREDETVRPAGSLPAMMEVLRRPQQAGDAPASVVRAAQEAAAVARSPYAGTVDRADVRRVASAGGHRIYVAPLRGGAAALVILTDAEDRPVQRPYGLTPRLLRSGAYYLSYGLRSVGRGPDGMRSLQVQLVPDGVTRVEYHYPVWPGMLAEPTEGFGLPVSDNAAATVRRGPSAHQPVSEIRASDARGPRWVTRPSASGAGPVAPEAVCRGVTLPERPRRSPSRTGLTVRNLCRQMGLPKRAHRSGPGELLLLYPQETLFRARDGFVGLMTHLAPGDPFPPRLARGVPSTAAKLAR